MKITPVGADTYLWWSASQKHWAELLKKKISSPDICCRNVQFEIKHLNITHTWYNSVFARSLNKAIRQKTSITQSELRKNVYQTSRSSSQQKPSGITHN